MNHKLLNVLKLTVLETLVIVFILITGIQAQNVRSNNVFHRKAYDAQNKIHRLKNIPNPESYQFQQLPSMVTGQMNPQINVIRQDFNLTLRDAVILDCSKFYPDSPNPGFPNGYPAVIMCHGYGDRKESFISFAQSQASFGYCVYIFSMRGQGNSGGLSNLISLTEAQDLMELVNYIKHDQPSGLDSSKVLIMGGSQGGTIPYMAACNGMNVKCIISGLASPNFASSWIENGCIKLTLLWSLSYSEANVRYNSVTTAMLGWIYSNAMDKWDSLVNWMPVERNFANLVSQNTVPMMVENSWQDYFFNSYGNISTIPNLTAPDRYYFGAVPGHGGDVSETENTWHSNFFNEWFFYWLFNINNGILTRPKYHFASTSFPVNAGMWSFVHDSSSVWPVSGLTDLNLFFNPNGQIKTTANKNTNDNVVLNNKVAGGLIMQDAVDDQFTGAAFNSQFSKSEIIFTSPVLANKTRMIGTPTVKLDYSSNMNRAQFNYQIYEVQGTVQKLITRVNYTDRHNTIHNMRKTTLINGNSHSHIFQKGNKIRVIVTNLDTSPNDSSFIRTNPFVLPVLDNGNSKLFLSYNSYLTLPVQIMPISPGDPAGPGAKFFIDDEYTESIPDDNNTPVTFSLKQNYPNPFNPSTTIEFSVPQNSFVALKVYDVAGKEVASLANTQESTGIYSINFNSDLYHLSSGIYFYKLSTPGFSQVTSNGY